MTGIASQPTNRNFLSQFGFKLAIKRLPNVNYFAQTVTIPAITMAVNESPTPFVNIPRPGDKLTFEPLTIKFKVDEDLKNYREIFNWLVALGHPQNFDQTKAFSIQNALSELQVGRASTFVSDGTLIVQTSHKNDNIAVTFHDMFPVSLSELTFDSTDPDVSYIEATVMFRYRDFILADL